MTNKEHIEEIINRTFSRLGKAYESHREGINESLELVKETESRIVFPCYHNNETRISEQELRFVFVETFNTYSREKGLNLFYSIETPTRDTYSGFANKKEEPHAAQREKGEIGRSAEFDLVIYDENLNRIGLVEFKALNTDEHDHRKDFVKLDNEKEGNDGVLRYFIEVVKSYSEGTNGSTISSLRAKNTFNKKSIFFCYALEGKSTRKKNLIIKGEEISSKIQQK